jgi:hypothetical protein
MGATGVDGNEKARSWRTVAAGAAVVAGVAVTSSMGWWDGSGRTDEPRPDVAVVDTPPADRSPVADEAPAPAPAPADPGTDPAVACAPTGSAPVATGDGGATPNPWAAGNEAVRRWLEEHGQDAPGNG